MREERSVSVAVVSQQQREIGDGGRVGKFIYYCLLAFYFMSISWAFHKEKYEDIAGNFVLKEIFGVGFHGHFLVPR
ncbi:hypothetical protein GBA52_011157 [Prunus armeniaca]|nr:hypothetical protein GBA52_011157 [Prunus armeniaca]